jgi:hypothetical protein
VGRKLWEGIFLRHCNSVRAGRRRRKGAVYSLMELIRAIGPRRFRKTRIRPFCGVCHD